MQKPAAKLFYIISATPPTSPSPPNFLLLLLHNILFIQVSVSLPSYEFRAILMYSSSPSSAGPTLPTLATELVEIISHCLEPCDLLSLRLVCKQLYQKSLCVFETLLATIRTDLSQTSLQRLRVPYMPELRLYVKRLLIEPKVDGKLGQGLEWHRNSSNQLDVLSPGPQMLLHLLEHDLPKCRSLQIRSVGGTEDKADALTHSDAVALVLLLIPSLPTTSPVTSFLANTQAQGNSFLDAEKLPVAQCRQPSFLHAWANIQQLVLELDSTHETFVWALDLVLHATNLRMLSLGLGFDHSEAFIKRLCAADSALRSLESLSLARCHMTMAHLSQLTERCHGTLRELSLQQMSISLVSDWPIALGRLSSQAPLLESISVHWLWGYRDVSRTHVTFPSVVSDHIVPGSKGRNMTWTTKRWKGDQRVFGVKYRGPCVSKALEMLVRAAEPI